MAAVGDTDLDGFVDALDIANVLGGGRYDGVQPAAWEHGDFNYDGIVDTLDVADMIGAQLFDAGSYRTPPPPPPPPPPPETSPHDVAFAITNSWPGNFSGSVTIHNRGTTAINGWTLEFDMAATLTAGNLWGAEIVSVSGTRYRLRNASWTAGITAGGTVSFSFNAAGAATTQMTGKVFNGLPVA